MKQRQLIFQLPTITAMGFVFLLTACNPVGFRLAKNPAENQSPESPALPLVEEAPSSPTVDAPVAAPVYPHVPSVDLARTSDTPAVALPATPPLYTADVPPTTAPPVKFAKASPVDLETPRKILEPVSRTPVQFIERPTTERPAAGQPAIPPRITSGNCTAGTPLLTCMQCPSPVKQETEPQLSGKGGALLNIMTRACEVTNASDPENYRSPTRAELLRRMNRLSPVLYPDTEMTGDQRSTIVSLVSSNEAVQKMFSGIFYSGVTRATTGFETYFGLSTIEARYTLCYAKDGDGTVDRFGLTFTRANSTPMASKAYLDCYYRESSQQCHETEEYVAANVYRTQLRRGMTESMVNPFVSAQTASAQTCEWEKFDGKMDDAASARVNAWLASGFTVGLDIPSRGMCVQIKGPLANVAGIAFDAPITLAAYRCR